MSPDLYRLARRHRGLARSAVAVSVLSVGAIVSTFIAVISLSLLSAETLRGMEAGPFIWIAVWFLVLAVVWLWAYIAMLRFLAAMGAGGAALVGTAVLVPLMLFFALPLALVAVIGLVVWARAHLNGLGIPAGWLGCTQIQLESIREEQRRRGREHDPFVPGAS